MKLKNIINTCMVAAALLFAACSPVSFSLDKLYILPWENAIIGRDMNPFPCLYNLLRKLIQAHHVTNLQVSPAAVAMMRKAMLLHIAMSGQQPLMTAGTHTTTRQPSWHIVHMHHFALRVLGP